MHATIAAAAFLATTVVAQNVGTARVVNACTYDVHVCNVPAAYGGYDQIDKMLSPNDTYEQTFTELSNGMGWSIKLSKDASLENIMQYEYTYHPGEPIWYDLSDVNGNPWDGDWEITSEGDCTPKQSAYRYSTDDAYGMQDCPVDSVITVTLCSGESQNDGTAASASVSMSSAVATQTYAPSPTYVPSSTYVAPVVASTPATTYEAPASSATSVSWAGYAHSHGGDHSYGGGGYNRIPATSETPTTLATLTTPAPEPAGITITNVETAYVTEIVTATAFEKRAEHVHHHARHPHARA